MGTIVQLTESLAQAKRLRRQNMADRAELDEALQDCPASLAHYQLLLAQLKETLARG